MYRVFVRSLTAQNKTTLGHMLSRSNHADVRKYIAIVLRDWRRQAIHVTVMKTGESWAYSMPTNHGRWSTGVLMLKNIHATPIRPN